MMKAEIQTLLLVCVGALLAEGRIPSHSISRDPCANFVCQNGGNCVAPADLPRCVCRPGYSGTRCQVGPTPSCGPCPSGWTCRPADFVCVQAPCPNFECRPPVPLDRCGGCPPGRRCRTIYPPCAPPPQDCFVHSLDAVLRRRRSIRCPHYRCDPVHVCM